MSQTSGAFFDHLTRATNGVHEAELLQTTDDEWLEKDERHLLWKTTLVQLELMDR